MTTSFPPLVTPNPGIHNPPSVPQPTPQTALGVINQGTNISTGVAGQVSTALTGVGGVGNPFSALASFGQAALSAISNIGQMLINLGVDAIEGVTDIIQAAIQGVANIFDAIFSAFTGGLFGGGASQEQALGAMTATAETIQNTAKSVQALENQAAADSNNGVSVFVDFTDDADASSLPGFLESYRGNPCQIGTSGGAAVLIGASGSGFDIGWALYDGQPTNTDYQLVTGVFASAPSPAGGAIILICRSNESMTTFVYATASWFGIDIWNIVSGTETHVASLVNSPSQFYAGAAYSLQAGIEGSPNTYSVKVNGATVLSWVDESNVTNIGEDYRYCGFGLDQFQLSPTGRAAAFGFNDNAPGALIGDMFRAYSTDSTFISIPNATAPQLAPAGFYDTISLASSNYSYDPSTNTLTIAKAGIYVVEVSTQYAPNAADTFTYFGAAVFKNGELYRQGRTPGQANPGAEPFFSIASDTFTVQIDDGDFIQPGWYSYSTPTGDSSQIAGDPAAELAIFSCALLNTGQAAPTT